MAFDDQKPPEVFDAVIVGGGPAGATAANDLAERGWRVALLDKPGRIKPCGGAVPPELIRAFDIPETQIVARANTARMISPKGRRVDMPIEGGSVGMVDREHFDEWLRERARQAGAVRLEGAFIEIERDGAEAAKVCYRPHGADKAAPLAKISTRAIIGADGAKSKVAEQEVQGADEKHCVFAYHEIIRSPRTADIEQFEGSRCEIYYDGRLSPDFYAWVFPHGETTSVGVGS
ncbi:MAG: geranylgeranyl reductase family protein, partial [Pseudomonadota bacterium]